MGRKDLEDVGRAIGQRCVTTDEQRELLLPLLLVRHEHDEPGRLKLRSHKLRLRRVERPKHRPQVHG